MQKKPKVTSEPVSINVNGFSQDEIRKIRKVFSMFEDKHTGKIDIKQLKFELESLNYDETSPVFFQLVSNLEEEGEMDFNKFMGEISSQLGNKQNEEVEENENESRSRINKLFDLWSNNEDYLDREKLGKLAVEFDVAMDDRELNELVERAAANNQEITKEDFYNIMVRKQM